MSSLELSCRSKKSKNPGVRIIWCGFPSNFYKGRWRMQAPPGPHPFPWVFAVHEKIAHQNFLHSVAAVSGSSITVTWLIFIFSLREKNTMQLWQNRDDNIVIRWGTDLQLFGLSTLKLTNLWPFLLWYSTKLYHQRTTSMETWFWQSTQVTSGAVTSAGIPWYVPIFPPLLIDFLAVVYPL